MNQMKSIDIFLNTDMWALNCCECLQFSFAGHPCLLCGYTGPRRVLIPRCNLVSTSESLSNCLVLLVPGTRSVSLKQSILHIGMVTSSGRVLELDRHGVRLGVWKKKRARLLEIPINAPSDWDQQLMAHMERERKTKFDKLSNNCLDFVVRLLNRALFAKAPLSRHEVSGLFLAPWLGRYQLQTKLQVDNPVGIWLIRPGALRTRQSHMLSCDVCDDCPDHTVRSCVVCKGQVCSMCVFVHVCVPGT